MKKILSFVMAFVIAIFISGQASAANWSLIEDDGGIVTEIDTDSIKRGTESKKFPQFNRTDGFSAVVRITMQLENNEKFEMVNLMSFYEADGDKMYRLLESSLKDDGPITAEDAVEGYVETDGEIWIKVWNFIQAKLK